MSTTKYYDQWAADYPWPRDMVFTRPQMHHFAALADRFGVDPGEIQKWTTVGDDLDPIWSVLRQIAGNPPVERGDLNYTDFGRVIDPSQGGTFHRGHAHETEWPPSFEATHVDPADRGWKWDNFQRSLQQVPEAVSQATGASHAQQQIGAWVRQVQGAFPPPTPPPPGYFQTGPAPIEMQHDPLRQLIKMLAGATGDVISPNY